MFAKFLMTGIAVAALAVAQGGAGGGAGAGGDPTGGMGSGPSMGGGRGGGADSGAGGGGQRVQKQSKADMMVSRLKLNSGQQSEFETILQSTAKEAQPVVQGLFQSRQNLANGLIGGKSEAEIATLKVAIADAQFQMTGVEVKTFQRILGLLKPNQLAKAPEAFDIMTDIFLPQMGAGGGAGRGRGGR